MNILEKIRAQRPVILCLTNNVTIDFVANALLAVGAAPIMSESIDELSELVEMAQAVYLNIGTLNESFLQRVMFAVEVAHQLQRPIIFDPVGCGATKLRRDVALKILPKVNIVRGNASEIMALVRNKKMRGVEASHTAAEAIADGIKLSQQYETTVVVSGATDIIINADYYENVSGGSALMKVVTGMGCTLTAVIAAFHAVEKDTFKAAYAAVNYYAGCGQSAATQASSPGSFKVAFLDALFNLKTAVDSRRYCTTS